MLSAHLTQSGMTPPLEQSAVALRTPSRERRAPTPRGFTLVELLAVVAMIGILAALAIVGYRKYLNSSKSAEAREIIGQIQIAETSYRAETLGYLSCSASLADWYPAAPDGRKRHWVNPAHSAVACWRMLNVTQDSPTYYGFAVVAGAPGTAPPAPNTAQKPTWPTTITEPWYVIQAAGDNDHDGTFSYFLSSSFQPSEIYVENDAE